MRCYRVTAQSTWPACPQARHRPPVRRRFRPGSVTRQEETAARAAPGSAGPPENAHSNWTGSVAVGLPLRLPYADLVHAVQPPLTLLHDLRLERPGPVSRHVDLDLAGTVGQHRLGAAAVADIPAAAALASTVRCSSAASSAARSASGRLRAPGAESRRDKPERHGDHLLEGQCVVGVRVYPLRVPADRLSPAPPRPLSRGRSRIRRDRANEHPDQRRKLLKERSDAAHIPSIAAGIIAGPRRLVWQQSSPPPRRRYVGPERHPGWAGGGLSRERRITPPDRETGARVGARLALAARAGVGDDPFEGLRGPPLGPRHQGDLRPVRRVPQAGRGPRHGTHGSRRRAPGQLSETSRSASDGW
jgi:hypothetical protein